MKPLILLVDNFLSRHVSTRTVGEELADRLAGWPVTSTSGLPIFSAHVTVTEAMACDLCVISTDAGGLADLVDAEADALLVPRDAVDEMARAVAHLLTDSQLAARLSAAARRKVEGFAWERQLPEWESILKSILEKKEDPPSD